ncbi:peroxiredoxin [Streptomyces sp. NPDC102270]|uniref:peroxiredoxin n=1 Tax=Streptomyces sp. NPDC102270 TaxID=3366150 RepID=UPI00381A96D3
MPLDELGADRSVLYLYPLSGRPDVNPPEGWESIPGAAAPPRRAAFATTTANSSTPTTVYGLSCQDTAYQQEVVKRLRPPFALLSNPCLEPAAALGLPTFEADGTQPHLRLTLIVHDGMIEHAFHPIDEPGEHAGQVLAWLKGTR